MTLQTVHPYGSVDVSIPIGQQIAISSNGGDNTTIWYKTNDGVTPIGWRVNQVINNSSVTLGTFTGIQGVRIETQSNEALYDIGVSPSLSSGDSATVGGLLPTQFLRSDADDMTSGKLGIGAVPGSYYLRVVADETGDDFGVAEFSNSDGCKVKIVGDGTGADALLHLLISGERQYSIGIDGSDVYKLKIGPNADVASNNSIVINPTTGYVGVGNAGPTDQLDVSGNALVSGLITAKDGYKLRTENGQPTKKFKFDNANTGVYDYDVYGESAGFTIEALKGNDKLIFNEDGNTTLPGTLTVTGAVSAGNGATGSIDTTATQTITVTNGIITAIA